MKKTLAQISISLLIFLGIVWMTGSSAVLNKNEQTYSDSDTLSNMATVTHTLDNEFDRQYDFLVQVTADSLSGTTGVTAEVQVSASKTSTRWTTVKTVSITGDTTFIVTTDIPTTAERVRVNYTGTASQSTILFTDAAVKRSLQ